MNLRKRWFNKKVLILGGATLVVIIAAYYLLGGGRSAETVKVAVGDITRTLDDNGYVRLVRDYDIQATQTARVLQIMAQAGDMVKQGQPLVLLENLDLGVQSAQAAASLYQAQAAAASAVAERDKAQLVLQDNRTQLERMQKLLDIGAVSQVEYNQARLAAETSKKTLQELESSLQTSQAQVQELTVMLEKLQKKEEQLTVTSPVDGQVLSLGIKEAQVVMPGTQVVKVGVPGEMEIEAKILSDDLAEIKIGQQVKITAPVLGDKILTGTVKSISPLAEEKVSALGVIQRRVPVVIAFPASQNLQSGYEVKVSIITNQAIKVPVIPREALRTGKDGKKEVMQVLGGRVKVTVVEAGLADNNQVEIRSGLKEGDIIIKDATADIPEKTRIKSSNKDDGMGQG